MGTPKPSLSSGALRTLASAANTLSSAFWIGLFTFLFGMLQWPSLFCVMGVFFCGVGISAANGLKQGIAELAGVKKSEPVPAPEQEKPVTLEAPPVSATMRTTYQGDDMPEKKVVRRKEPEIEIDWEQWVGKKLLQKVGIAIVLIGMAIFLKYSFDNRWIDELGRVVLSGIAAFGLIGVGEYYRSKYRNWALSFTGGGLALLYFTVWVAHIFYGEQLSLLTNVGAFVLYAAITATGALAAIRYNSQVVAWFAIIGGYLTPLLIKLPEQSPIMLAVYLGVLTMGIVVIAYRQKWMYLNFVAFALTQLYLICTIYSDVQVNETITISIAFFILFSLPALFNQYILRLKAEGPDCLVIVLNTLITFGALLSVTSDWHALDATLVCFGMAAIQGIFAAAAYVLRRNDDMLLNTHVSFAVIFATLGLNSGLETQWIAAGLAPFSVLLLALSIALKKDVFRYWSHAVFAVLVYLELSPVLDGWNGSHATLICFGLAIMHVVNAVLTYVFRSEDEKLFSAYVSFATAFTGLFFLSALQTEWVSAALAPLSVALLALALTLNRKIFLDCAHVLFAAAMLFLITNIPYFTDASWRPLLSPWAIQSYIAVAAFIAWALALPRLPKNLLRSEAVAWGVSFMHCCMAAFAFAWLTLEFTTPLWHADVTLLFAYVGFSAAALLIFYVSREIAWFIAAVIVNVFVLFGIFGWTDQSPLAVGSAQTVTPLLHVWTLLSLGSLLLSVGLMHLTSLKRSSWGNDVKVLFIVIALAQVWLHGTVELMHLSTYFSWDARLADGVRGAWWIIFALALLGWGYQRRSVNWRIGGMAILAIPFLTDLYVIASQNDAVYETGLWTVLSLILLGLGAKLKHREVLVGGLILIGATAGIDMITHLGNAAGLLRSVWWAVVALATMGIGFATQEADVRRMSIAIFGGVTAKLLIFDFSVLETPARIIASIVTGLLLIGASYLYQRFDEKTK